MEYYNYLKSLHLIFVITWFAGLFYIVRLFVYQIEAENLPRERNSSKQYKIMTYRLWYIITWHLLFWQAFCFLDVVFTDLGQAWLKMPWMHVNLACICYCTYTMQNANKFTSNCKMMSEVFHKFHAFVERRRNNYPFAVVFLVF
jgi:putative membrane protein